MEEKVGLICKKLQEKWAEEKNIGFYLSLLYHQTKFVYDHSCRVAYYAYNLAKQLAMTEEECCKVGMAGLLHDIGKLYIPSKILYKPTELTEEEFREVQKHVLHSSHLLNNCKEIEEFSLPILFHHERWDGKGYPQGIKGEAIPLFSRILNLVDSFEAMTSLSGYRQIKTFFQAKQELARCSGNQFDPTLVASFLDLLSTMEKENTLPENIFFSVQQNCSGNSQLTEEIEDLSLEDLQRFLYNINDLGVLFLNKDNRIIFANYYGAQLRGFIPVELLGKNFLDCYQPHRKQILAKKLTELREGKRDGWTRVMGRGDKFIENRYSRVTDQLGNYLRTILLTIDITERENLSRQLKLTLERLSVLSQAAEIINSSLSFQEIAEKILALVKQIVVMEEGEVFLLGQAGMQPVVHGSSPATDYWKGEEKQIIKLVRQTKKTYRYLKIQEQLTITQLFIPFVADDKLLGFLYVRTAGSHELPLEQQEILETLTNQASLALRNAKLYEQVANLAIHDGLTGLYNRYYLEKVLETELNRVQEQETPLALLMIDLNGLKKVNDLWGHLAGDYLIKETCEVIKKSIRESDYIFRYGGDEIVVLLPGVEPEQLPLVIKRIAFNSRKWRGQESYSQLRMSLSIGVAHTAYVKADQLFLEADRKMYENKKNFSAGIIPKEEK